MKIIPDSFDTTEMESVGFGCSPFISRFRLLFESQEEVEATKRLLERLLEGEKNENS